MTANDRNIDPAQLAAINDLELLARVVVEGLMTGRHRSPQSGASIEFAQYRPYAQGDDPRFIDWYLYARTDRLHIKQFQDETNLRCTLLLDCSASMDYGSGPVTKFQYARMLVACLAMVLHQQRDAPGFIAYHNEMVNYVPPRASTSHVRRILTELENLKPAGTTNTGAALQYLGNVIKPRGMVVLVTDLLHEVDEMVKHLKSLRAMRHDLLVLQVSDPAEQTFPFELTATFIDPESGHEQYAVPETIREEYLANRKKHFDTIRQECLASEIDLEEFTTSEPLDRALRYVLRRRNQALLTSSGSRRKAGGRA